MNRDYKPITKGGDMVNKVYRELREYIKEHHGFSSDELTKTDLYKEYLATMEEIKKLNGKRVKLFCAYSDDWIARKVEKTGRISIYNDKPIFFEGKCRRAYYNLDAGLFEGCHATLCPLTIEPINQ